jgi:hypothetical protein
MRTALGDKCIPLVLNGCCGNVYHDDRLDPDFDPDDYKGMGANLAQTTVKALKKMKYMERLTLTAVNKHLFIPLREITDKKSAEARKMLEEYPMPKLNPNGSISWDWWFAMSTLDVQRHWGKNAEFDYEIQAFRIGDLALLALGGEPFVQGQLQIKRDSPASYTFIAHMCNYYVGYVPTREAFQTGGYETVTGLSSKLHPGALDTITEASLALIDTLFKG